MFGPRATQELNWQGHHPGTLSTNLRGIQISLWTGNARPGPLDSGEPNPGAEAIEAGVFQLNQLFHGHLVDEGIPSHYDYYGAGTHSWPYWARDLREYVGPLMRRFAHPAPSPRAVGYKTVDDPWSQWGWRASLQRPSPAFSSLSEATRHGFSLTGTGKATVVTPSFYKPGLRARVGESGSGREVSEVVKAGREGRLKISVPLSDGLASATTTVTIKHLAVSGPFR